MELVFLQSVTEKKGQLHLQSYDEFDETYAL